MPVQLQFSPVLNNFNDTVYTIKKALKGVRLDVYRDSVGLATNGAGSYFPYQTIFVQRCYNSAGRAVRLMFSR